MKQAELEDKIQVEMKLCAYTIQCDGFLTDFLEKKDTMEENILYKDKDFYSYYKVPTVEKYLMKVVYPKEEYLQRVDQLKTTQFHKFLLYSFFVMLVSLVFSWYALFPLRRALWLNEEFVKDILHDFNTPMSSMRINLKLFKREIGENSKIDRLENNMETILALQHNLQIFLKGVPTQSETFSLDALVENRAAYFRILYSDIAYRVNLPELTLHTNRDALTRILDNLLSNAGKYNKPKGSVSISYKDNLLAIIDTGKGIKHPSKVFHRYYKEQDRGIGIGMHIVKKLCEELEIELHISSKVDHGTTITLNIENLLKK